MSYAFGPRNPLWRHGNGTIREIARRIIQSGHGLRGAGLREWYEKIEQFGVERLQPTNLLRDLIEKRSCVSRSLGDLRPEVRPMVDAFLADCVAEKIDLLITCTLRSLIEQEALYAQGRTAPGQIVTNAKPGESAHNYGLAIDVVPIVNGKPDWNGDHSVWQKIGALGQLRGLQWFGVPGSPYKEDPHFQHPGWRALAGIG